ncbi:MAG: flagellar biosynthesis anti-sigma factor FlgM [Chloroflexota bacterium]|nr:flagellar biosynthesis anti-sigma factor FlgM [Chloroflexota bacterium]
MLSSRQSMVRELGARTEIALHDVVMARRDDAMDEPRPKKSVRQKRDQKKRATTSHIEAAGTQPLGEREHDSSGFQPWLQDDQYLIRSRTSQQRRNKSVTSAAEERVAPLAPLRGVQAVRHEMEMRAARVEELQRRVASGTYEVDSTALARRMLGMDRKQDLEPTEDS